MVLKKGHTNVCAESLGFSGPRVTPFLSFQKQKIVFAAARFFIMRIQSFIGITMLIGREPACRQFLPRDNSDSVYSHPPD